MSPEGSAPPLAWVVSRREARLLFWLVVLALVGVIFSLWTEFFAVLASPAVILFIAWLMSYVLEPPVSFVQRHLPFKGRGVAVAITYLVTAIVAFTVIASKAAAVLAVTDYVRQRDVPLRATDDEPEAAVTIDGSPAGWDA
jgi:predicted PurR-regulated permease PerM